MNQEELPLGIIKELKTIIKSIRQIDEFDDKCILEPIAPFGFKITFRKEKRFFYEINQYGHISGSSEIILQGNRNGVNQNNPPFDVETFRTYFYHSVENIKSWLAAVEAYLEDDTDFDSLFKTSEPILITESEDIYDKEFEVLDFALKTLKVTNFQGIKELKIENLPISTQWVFLVGENGFGKTTILQAILMGLHGTKDNATNLISDKTIQIKVEYKSEGSNIINDCWDNEFPLKHLAAYGSSRLNLQADASEKEVEVRSALAYSLFETDGVLLNINAELYKWALKKETNRFNLMKKAFCALIPYLDDIKYNKTTDQIEYIEKDIDQQTYQPLPFKKLASGFKSIVGIVGDMIIRLTRNQPNAQKPADLNGIVIIDEIDLHFHPKLQKQLPALLSKVFPKVQFIVSTHSPIPLLGAPQNSVILKVLRNKNEGIQVERIDIDLKYLTPNILLTSGIFDMEDFLSVQNDDLTKTRTETNESEMVKNDGVEAYLKAFEAGNEQFPDDLFETKVK